MTAPLQFRVAENRDLDTLLKLLPDDPLGTYGELTKPFDRATYATALNAIRATPHSDFIVAEENGSVVGCLQLTLIPGLSHGGTWRALIESVRIASPKRGRGIGTALLKHAIAEARRKGATLVQLTSDTRRTEAHKFYKALGFSISHTTFKQTL